MPNRLYWTIPGGLDSQEYRKDNDKNRKLAVLKEEAELVSSLTDDGQHLPALDLDVPARLYPSRTEGHFHLYIDVPMSWRKYKKLMRVMAQVGILEKAYYRHSKSKGASFLRLPKPGLKKKKNVREEVWVAEKRNFSWVYQVVITPRESVGKIKYIWRINRSATGLVSVDSPFAKEIANEGLYLSGGGTRWRWKAIRAAKRACRQDKKRLKKGPLKDKAIEFIYQP